MNMNVEFAMNRRHLLDVYNGTVTFDVFETASAQYCKEEHSLWMNVKQNR